jgi:hypothetical protein
MADGGPKEIGSGSWRWIGSLVLLSILLVVMLYLLYAYPHQGIGPQQPIYFSHRIHSGVKQIDCRFCHPGVDYSQNAGIPTVQKCLCLVQVNFKMGFCIGCHQQMNAQLDCWLACHH